MFSKSHSKRADNHEEPSLLVRIGGPAALQAAVETFYEKLIADESLAKFFDGVNIDNLKIHQHRFLSLALTGIPPEFDVPTVIKVTHKRLFKMGLNETHFDSVVGHLMDALKDLQVKDEHIEEIISILAPLRTIFKNAGKRSLLDRIGGSAALEAAIDIFYEKMLADSTLTKFFMGVNMDDLKAHQRGFFTLAFTEMPHDVDVRSVIISKHQRLFRMGLDETHFDTVTGHLTSTLDGLQVKEELIDEVVAILSPLRVTFQEGANQAGASAF